MANYESMSTQALARQIATHWGSKVYYAAKPYLQAMLAGDYGFDGEQSVLL